MNVYIFFLLIIIGFFLAKIFSKCDCIHRVEKFNISNKGEDTRCNNILKCKGPNPKSSTFCKKYDYSHCSYNNKELNDLVLNNVNLNSSIFKHSNLSKSIFQDSILDNVIIDNCAIQGSNFSNSKGSPLRIINSDLTNTNMSNITIIEGDLQNNDLSGTDFSNATLYNTDFTNSKFNDNTKFINTKCDDKTILPNQYLGHDSVRLICSDGHVISQRIKPAPPKCNCGSSPGCDDSGKYCKGGTAAPPGYQCCSGGIFGSEVCCKWKTKGKNANNCSLWWGCDE